MHNVITAGRVTGMILAGALVASGIEIMFLLSGYGVLGNLFLTALCGLAIYLISSAFIKLPINRLPLLVIGMVLLARFGPLDADLAGKLPFGPHFATGFLQTVKMPYEIAVKPVANLSPDIHCIASEPEVRWMTANRDDLDERALDVSLDHDTVNQLNVVQCSFHFLYHGVFLDADGWNDADR